VRSRFLFDTYGYTGKKRVWRNRLENVPKRKGALLAQALGNGVDLITSVTNDCLHLLPCFLGHVPVVVEHSRYCRRRDTGALGNVLERGSL